MDANGALFILRISMAYNELLRMTFGFNQQFVHKHVSMYNVHTSKYKSIMCLMDLPIVSCDELLLLLSISTSDVWLPLWKIQNITMIPEI